MSKSQSFDQFEENLDDPFANLGKSKFTKKSYLRDNNIPFNITAVTGPGLGKFGEEVTLDIEFIDYMTGEVMHGGLSFPVQNKAGKVSPRTTALLTMQKGIALGKVYDGYYLGGSGNGYLLSKTPNKVKA